MSRELFCDVYKEKIELCDVCGKDFKEGDSIICIYIKHGGGHIHEECKREWIADNYKELYIGEEGVVEVD